MKTIKFALASLSLAILASCAPPLESQGNEEQSCVGQKCSETDINAPVDPTADTEENENGGSTVGLPGAPGENPSGTPATNPAPIQGKRYSFPAFQTSWGLPKRMYDKMERYYQDNIRDFSNTRYVTIVDFSQHSSKKRFYLFDLQTQKVERYLTTHGRNSDLNNDGFADSFSNVEGSKQSSLGFYKTLGTYTGQWGHSMRLEGLSDTNSNAYRRAIVVHPADYVQEEIPRAGRSWGCPALDPDVSRSIIERIKSGSLMLIDQ